jgi:protocatechuate 3,4-dioxygenase beta subunit
MEGTRLTLTGRVITGECEPIAGAELDFWQTDANGDYDNLGYTLRGRTFSDEQGRYQLVTILPGIYPGRPAHIHVKVTPPGGETLTTQIYFPGERFGDADRAVDPTLLAQWGDPADGGERATFDFVLSP